MNPNATNVDALNVLYSCNESIVANQDPMLHIKVIELEQLSRQFITIISYALTGLLNLSIKVSTIVSSPKTAIVIIYVNRW